MWQQWQAWDAAILTWVQGFASAPLDWVAAAVANPVMMIPAGLLLAGWVVWGLSPWRAAYLVALAAVLLCVNESVVWDWARVRVARPHPFQSVLGSRRVEWVGNGPRVGVTADKHLRARGGSFPALHVMNNVALAVVISVVARRRVVTLGMVCWCGVVGWSRVYAGAHFPSDVAGSVLLGLGLAVPWCGAAAWAVRRFLPARAANLLDEARLAS